jgi:acyl-homoserine-lactone acylase
MHTFYRKKSYNTISTLISILCYLILIVFVLNGCAQKETNQSEILWDTWGVPHIFGKDESSLFYAFGWAQMKSHGDLILQLYGKSRGRAAEYWGESYIDEDRFVHTVGIPKRSNLWYKSQHSDFKSYLDAFVAGMNDYVKANGQNIEDSLKVVLPVKAEDVLAHTQRVIHFTFVGGAAMGTAESWNSKGSNAWAIAPSHSESGNAMLLANPHLPWSDFFLFYEAQLSAPGIDAYGASLVGMPSLAIAFNNYLGWSHTVNTYDGMDLYELTLTGNGYIFDDEIRSFDEEMHILKVKQNDGSLREEKITVRHSVHGPILAEKDEKAIAVRIAGLDKPHLLAQQWDMSRSTNLSEFEDALKRMQLPMFNVIYADRDGHIMYLFNGLVPKRTEGDWNFWQGIIPGDKSTTLWTETLPYNDLPRVVDPPNGWVQNANDPPWTSTFPMVLEQQNYPLYISPQGMFFRQQRSVQMLIEDNKITFDELVEYKHSTQVEMADRILDDLLSVAKKSGNNIVKNASIVLETWDRKADADSRGAVLFNSWVEEIGLNMFAEPWNAKAPLTTPNGLANPEAAISALEKAAQKVSKDYGALDVPWGDVYRLRYDSIDFPANGGPDYMGIFRVLYFAPDEDKLFRANNGDSYVAIVEFSDPVRANVLLSYGNSTQPNSPHRGDQLELFSQKKLRPVWRTREQIEQNLELKEVFEK